MFQVILHKLLYKCNEELKIVLQIQRITQFSEKLHLNGLNKKQNSGVSGRSVVQERIGDPKGAQDIHHRTRKRHTWFSYMATHKLYCSASRLSKLKKTSSPAKSHIVHFTIYSQLRQKCILTTHLVQLQAYGIADCRRSRLVFIVGNDQRKHLQTDTRCLALSQRMHTEGFPLPPTSTWYTQLNEQARLNVVLLQFCITQYLVYILVNSFNESSVI